LREFRKRASQFNSVITVPEFETTTNADPFRPAANHRGRQRRPGPPWRPQAREVTFENTVRALDDIGYQISLTDDRFGLIKETSTDAAMREPPPTPSRSWRSGPSALTTARTSIRPQGLRGPEAEAKGEDAKLLAETMRDYRRAGLELPKAQRDEVERMRKELSRLTTDYESNITKAQKAVKFTKAELEGVPEASWRRSRPATTNTPSWRTSPGITSA
jgi:Zn-dependent oligopeptidase